MTVRKAVVALGGNAISPKKEPDTIANQFRHTRESLGGIVDLIRKGYRIAITHGNGPQVGNAMLRVEMARGRAPELPLGICVADVAGGMGYMIEQSLQNRLRYEGIDRRVATVITQVIVDRNDPSLLDPNKFVGARYDEDEADRLRQEMGWRMEADGEWGCRRVVPSPLPGQVLSADIIRMLVESDVIVVTAGGGGVPVYVEEDGTFEGLDAVVDKDRTSAILALEIGAELLVILTDVSRVALDYGKETQKDIDRMTLSEASRYLKEGHFPRGTMGPKIKAAIDFLSGGGEEVIIASIHEAFEAVEGMEGTHIVPDPGGNHRGFTDKRVGWGRIRNDETL
jgi:carbamate kinase